MSGVAVVCGPGAASKTECTLSQSFRLYRINLDDIKVQLMSRDASDVTIGANILMHQCKRESP